jgi:PTS system nitrogen regulatory IIA component
MTIGDLLEPGAVALRVSAANKRQVLGVIADVAARVFGVDADEALEGLVERESRRLDRRGRGRGAPARPAGPWTGSARCSCAWRPRWPSARSTTSRWTCWWRCSRPRTPIPSHLRALARISRMMRQPDVREQLRKARSADAVHVMLTHEATSTAA